MTVGDIGSNQHRRSPTSWSHGARPQGGSVEAPGLGSASRTPLVAKTPSCALGHIQRVPGVRSPGERGRSQAIARITNYFSLDMKQGSVDFVDEDVHTDVPVFNDPTTIR